MIVQDDDKLSYASISIQSHGFDIRMNAHAFFPAEVSSMGIELKHTGGERHQPIMIDLNEMEMMVFDNRDDVRQNSFVIVFKYGKTEEEILNLIHPQLKMWMGRFKKMYEMLLKNTDEMLAVLENGPVKQHLCPIEKEKE